MLGCYAAYAAGDIKAAVAPLADDVEWIEPDEFPNGGTYRGRNAVADYLGASRARWAELTVEPQAHLRGGRVVIVVRHHGRLTSGVERDITVADVFTARGGKIVQMRAYANPSEALAISPTEA